MIDSTISIDTLIDGVEEIEVGPISFLTIGPYRIITIRTKHKENYYLKLQAESSIELRLRRDQDDREYDWLNPVLYKGDLEEDEP